MRDEPRQRGFTLLELAVVVCAIALLTGLALERLLPLIGRAQRVAFLAVQRELQSALMLEAAERITRGEAHTLAELAGGNPMSLLLSPPANYLGSMAYARDAELPRASWYFDEEAGHLAYRVGRSTRFEATTGPQDLIEMRVAFVYQDRDADGEYNAARDRFDGLRFEPVHAYRWPD